MAIIAPVARTLAALCERSPFLTWTLRHSRFPLRCRVVSEVRNVPGPRERVARSHGANYRFDLQDELQRWIYFGCYENAALRQVLRLLPPGGVCLDVGANIGFYSLPMALQVGPGGAVHAFEPDPRNAARLRENGALNGAENVLRVHEAAVTNYSGRATLFQSDAAHSGWGSLSEFQDVAAERTEVEAITLDAFLAREGISRVDFLKADVEAGEFELLEGAKNAMAGGVFRRILIEFNGVRLSERGKTFPEFLACFTAHDYHPVGDDEQIVTKLLQREIVPETSLVNLWFERRK